MKTKRRIGGIIICILVSFLVTAGAAIPIAITLAVVDLYVDGHNMAPKNWSSIKEWMLEGAVALVFLISLIVSLRAWSYQKRNAIGCASDDPNR